MNGADKRKFCGILLALLSVAGGLTLVPAEFRLSEVHAPFLVLVQTLRLMASGALAHLDFPTVTGPLGVRPFLWARDLAALAGWPAGLGFALGLGQFLVVLAILPPLWWVAVSRMGRRLAAFLALVLTIVIIALVPGEGGLSLGLDAHAVRWSWAWATLALLIVVVPARVRRADEADGLALGGALTVLALTRSDLALALSVPVALGLVYQFRARVLAIAIGVLLIVWAVLFWRHGTAYWAAWARDLGASCPGLADPALWPTLLPGRLTPGFAVAAPLAAGAALLLRRASRGAGATLLLVLPFLLLAGLLMDGTGMLWLMPVAFALMALLPDEGDGPRRAIAGAALATLVLMAPMLAAMAASPVRHLMAQNDPAGPILPATPDLALLGAEELIRVETRLAPNGAVPAGTMTFGDRPVPDCRLAGGVVSALRDQAMVLAGAGLVDGRQPFVADITGPHWILAPLDPLPGMAPRQDRGLPGLAGADMLLVPDCPLDPAQRARILTLIAAGDMTVTEVFRGEMFTLYSLDRP